MAIEIIPDWMANLDDEDVIFIKKFILASGSLKEIASQYHVTYPTVRLRLDKIIQKILISEDTAVRVIVLPMVFDKLSLSFAPKNWDTMMLVPIDIPIKSTSSRFKIGLALPTAARALSPTYFPTTILSTVL